MANPYVEYYTNQAGTGLTGFQGYRYQRGHGFFGNLYSSIIKPLAKYFGKKALSTGVQMGKDILSGQNFKESAKKRLIDLGEEAGYDGIKRAKQYFQTGKGRKRRRKNRKRSSIKTLLMANRRRKSKRKPKSKRSKKRRSVKKKRSKSKDLFSF